ncbi:7711_t:CDS:2 [Acaulospora colombiana]|uniref:7711_t:CDS:1 n=1 Tax=Acaulospora colombiana TaxID=27376 RepID=A0ACA9KW26_9GLOM|nr:7711_t:CDS:2 [Acaulospora colombiana]
MGKLKEKGKSGAATNYITRNQALKKLQLTLADFRQTLVGFVNFKLFTDENLTYPPKFDALKDEGSGGLNALIIETKNVSASLAMNSLGSEDKEQLNLMNRNEKVQKLKSEERLKTLSEKLDTIKEKEVEDHAEDLEADVSADLMDDFTEQTSTQHMFQDQMSVYRDIQSASIALSEFEQLFSRCIIYLSREVPRYSLEFVIRAFGGQVGWDDTVGVGSPFKENDDRITHHITDRSMPRELILTRAYVQPQWVYDCVNARKLLRTKQYQPDKVLPAHLSPFVEYKDGDYLPEGIDDGFEGTESETDLPNNDVDDESETEELIHQKELEAETIGIPFSKYQENRERTEKQKKNTITSEREISSHTLAGKKRGAKEIEEEENKELAKIMMPKKQKKLYKKMQYGKKRQEEKVLNLKRKKEIIEQKKRSGVINPKKGQEKKR